MSGQNLMEIDQIVFESGLENQYAILFAGTVHIKKLRYETGVVLPYFWDDCIVNLSLPGKDSVKKMPPGKLWPFYSTLVPMAAIE